MSDDTTPPTAPAAAAARHILVLANETVAGKSLIDALRKRAEQGPIRVTVVAPQNEPEAGLVVWEASRRSSARRRLERTLELLEREGIPALGGAVVEPDPLNALRDALYLYNPDEVIISTHPETRSRWLRGNLVDRARKIAKVPVEHVVVDLSSPRETDHVLVIANQTMVGDRLLAQIRERARESATHFTLVAPVDQPGAERRLEVALAKLREADIDASGHVGDPDPVTAAVQALRDEPLDGIIVSTLPEAKSGWMRKNVVERIAEETKLPVRHIEVEPAGEDALG